jgi:RimJ/RimL family protein N-acetyltransferase
VPKRRVGLFAVEDATVPTLVTGRLRLRPMRRRDLDPLHEAVQETLVELIRWLPWANPGHSRADTRRYIRQARLARMRGSAYEFAIFDQEGKALLGVVGLHRLDWSRRSAGIGYWTRHSNWNRGVATEAAATLVDHAFQRLQLNRVEAHVALENRRSQKVVEKLGFHREGVARALEPLGGEFIDHFQYSLVRREIAGLEPLP